MPEISVIMPAYNVKADEFSQAVDSLLSQTFGDFELIIINDGSTNNTEDLILSYSDNRIKYLKNEKNLGIVGSLNRGLEVASGEFIARLDTDDYSEPTRFEKQIEFLKTHPEVGLLGSNCIEIPTKRLITPPTNYKDSRLVLRYCNNCFVHSSVMFRKSVLDKHNLKYCESAKHAEDYKLWCELSKVCEVTSVPEVLTYFRQSPDGISSRNRNLQAKIAKVITLDNIIGDLAVNKDYMFSILVKYLKTEPLLEGEYNDLVDLLQNTTNVVYDNISDLYKPIVKSSIFSILNFVIKRKV